MLRSISLNTESLNTENWREALDLVISRTGVGRYAWLASDANTLPAPNDPATWRRWLLEEAARPDEPGAIRVDYGDPAQPGRPCCP